jgi:Zn-finger nucleic acid-binding protein
MLNSNPSASNFSNQPYPHQNDFRCCPVCQSALNPFRFHEIETDMCEKGCGVWFDDGEMKRMEASDNLENIDQAFPGKYVKQISRPSLVKESPTRSCPVDNTLMSRYEWNQGSGIVLDKCETCHGVWMDAGELEGYCKFIKDFYKYPPELTPALREKIGKVRQQFEKEWDAEFDHAANVVVPWDLWFIDDLCRDLLKAKWC